MIAEAFQNFADNRKMSQEQIVPETTQVDPKKSFATTQQFVPDHQDYQPFVDPRYSARGPQRNPVYRDAEELVPPQVQTTEVRQEPEKIWFQPSPQSRTTRPSNEAPVVQ